MRKIERLNARATRRLPLWPGLRAALEGYFRDDIDDLSLTLGRDLAGWP